MFSESWARRLHLDEYIDSNYNFSFLTDPFFDKQCNPWSPCGKYPRLRFMKYTVRRTDSSPHWFLSENFQRHYSRCSQCIICQSPVKYMCWSGGQSGMKERQSFMKTWGYNGSTWQLDNFAWNWWYFHIEHEKFWVVCTNHDRPIVLIHWQTWYWTIPRFDFV